MSKQLIPLITLVGAVALIALASGCASGGAKVISTGGSQSITSIEQIDIQDFINSAESATQKLLASGALDKVPKPPAILAMSLIVNNTGSQIDTDLLTRRIRVRLNESGKAKTTTIEGIGGAEDPLAKGRKEQNDFLNDKKIVKSSADFSLSGKIIETRATAGRVRQSTFTFALSLTDNEGNAVWEGLEEVTKQGKRPSVGF
jgi:penicillin-binding protein activator